MLDIQLNDGLNEKSSTKVQVDLKTDKSANGIDAKTFTFLINAKVLIRHKEYKLALNLLRQAASRYPKNPEILKILAIALESLEKWSEVKAVYIELSRQFNNFHFAYKKAQAHYMLNDDETALTSYYEALSHLQEEESELFELYKNMGNIFVRQKDFESAEESYNKAYTLNSRSDTLLINFGTLEVQREDFDKALFCFRQAIEINPKNDKAWIGLALVHNHFGDHELAWGNVIKSLDIDAYNRTGVLLLGHWGNTNDKIQISLHYHLEYLKKFEFDEEITLQVIQIYSQLSDFDKAENEALKLYLWCPENENYKKLYEEIKNKNSKQLNYEVAS